MSIHVEFEDEILVVTANQFFDYMCKFLTSQFYCYSFFNNLDTVHCASYKESRHTSGDERILLIIINIINFKCKITINYSSQGVFIPNFILRGTP
jgi:hypothetical protein